MACKFCGFVREKLLPKRLQQSDPIESAKKLLERLSHINHNLEVVDRNLSQAPHEIAKEVRRFFCTQNVEEARGKIYIGQFVFKLTSMNDEVNYYTGDEYKYPDSPIPVLRRVEQPYNKKLIEELIAQKKLVEYSGTSFNVPVRIIGV